MAKQILDSNRSQQSQKKASTAFNVGDFVTVDTNGFLVPGGSGTIKGICNEKITSADTDYAVARDLNFTAFKPQDVFEVPIATGTGAQTQVGELHDIDATALGSIDVTAATNKQLEVTRIISTTLCWCKIVPQIA